jgi:hypothetical protein
MAVLIHRPSQIVAFAADREEYLIQMPLSRARTPTSELIGIQLSELAAPLADGFVGDDDPTAKEEIFHITVAQADAITQPDAMADDLGRKPMICVRVGGCGGIHRSSQDSLWVLRERTPHPRSGVHRTSRPGRGKAVQEGCG